VHSFMKVLKNQCTKHVRVYRNKVSNSRKESESETNAMGFGKCRMPHVLPLFGRLAMKRIKE
jgi:hypothetical protein